MDNGHTDNDNFEQSFMNSVNQAAGASMQPVVPVEPVAPVEPVPVLPQQPVTAAPQAQPDMAQPAMAQPAMAQPIVSNPTTSNEVEQTKKFPVFLVTTVVCAVLVIVLLVVMFMMGNKPNIASDPSENVKLSDAGNVEAIGVYCKMSDSTIYLELSNKYFIELNDISNTLVELDDGSYEQLEANLETGHYTIDGNSIHFIPDDGSDYRATYLSHELKIKDKTYRCVNYD